MIEDGGWNVQHYYWPSRKQQQDIFEMFTLLKTQGSLTAKAGTALELKHSDESLNTQRTGPPVLEKEPNTSISTDCPKGYSKILSESTTPETGVSYQKNIYINPIDSSYICI